MDALKKQLMCKGNYTFDDLLAVVRILRSPTGCPWDRAQTHRSIRRYLIEETYEVAEAIDEENPALLREELGDLLLQILFHAQIEEEAGRFSFADVANDEARKMVSRHPHVFGEAEAEETLANWEVNKNQEKARRTVADRMRAVPRPLPALPRAQKLLEKCAAEPALLREALCEAAENARAVRNGAPPDEQSAGDALLLLLNAIRAAGIDAEAALSAASERFIRRATAAEKADVH